MPMKSVICVVGGRRWPQLPYDNEATTQMQGSRTGLGEQHAWETARTERTIPLPKGSRIRSPTESVNFISNETVVEYAFSKTLISVANPIPSRKAVPSLNNNRFSSLVSYVFHLQLNYCLMHILVTQPVPSRVPRNLTISSTDWKRVSVDMNRKKWHSENEERRGKWNNYEDRILRIVPDQSKSEDRLREAQKETRKLLLL